MKKTLILATTATIISVFLSIFVSFSSEPAAQGMAIDTEWQLTVTGQVLNPLNLSIADLIAMPRTTIYAQIYCVGPPGFLVEEGNWTGVKLGFLLEKAGISPGAIKVGFYANDGFSTDLTIVSAKDDNVLVAYEKDSMPLNETLRLVVPGRWGYKWIHHLNRIELVDYDFLGKYESQGYSDSAEITQYGAPGSAGNLLPGEKILSRNGSSSISQDPPQNSSPSPSSNPPTIQRPPPTPNPQQEGGIEAQVRLGLTEEIIYAAAAVAAVSVVSLCLIYFFVKSQKNVE